MNNPEIQKVLSKLNLFSGLNEEELLGLASKFVVNKYSAGATIINKGSESDRFYIIFSGRAKVIDRVNDEDVILAHLQEGEFFGERSLIKNEPTSSTIKAQTQVFTLELSKDEFLKTIELNEDIKKYVEYFLFNRAVTNFLRKFSIFGELNPKDVANWLKLLKFEPEIKTGEYVFKQGDEPDKFFVVVEGEARVEIGGKTVTTLKEGQFFGELAIINDKPRAASIKAHGNLKLVSLGKEQFKQMLSSNKALAQKIRNVIEMYTLNPDDAAEFASVDEDERDFDESALNESLRIKGEPWDAKPKRSWLERIKKEYPFVYQYDSKDTASACISMISKYYGKHLGVSKVRDLASITQDTASIINISFAIESIGFNTKPLKIEIANLKKSALPAIAMMKKSRYCVIYEVEGGKVRVGDPAQGLISVDIKEFERTYEGLVLILEPTTRLQGLEDSKVSTARFLNILSPYRKMVSEIIIISFLVSLFGLAPVVFTRLVVDNILVHHNETLLASMMAAMFGVAVLLGISLMLKTYLMTYLGNKIQLQMLGRFFTHILALSAKFYSDRKVGDIISRFNENNRVQNLLAGSSLTLFVDIVMLIVYIAVMFSFHVGMASVVLGFIAAICLTTTVFTNKLKDISRQGFAKSAESDALLVETMTGIQTIKATSSEIQARWKWEDIFTQSLKLKFDTAMINSVSSSLGQTLRLLVTMLVLWYGSYLVIQKEMSVGQVMAMLMLVGMMLAPVQKILGMWSELQETLMSIERINDIYDVKPEEKLNEENMIHLPTIKGDVKFDKVSFAYNRESGYILKNVSLDVLAGQRVAIVGRSGSGKSTIINLLLRFYEPSAGIITIDGFNTQHVSVASLRAQIGTVLQDSYLFNGTIRENIALARPDAAFSEIIEAATLAAAHDFIKELPNGYNTVIGERGSGLSGGQKQRLSIARALLTNPRILIFDEATSALDNESEKAIQDNLATICEGRTTFIIAHRLSTVRDADTIIVMDKGYVAEVGTHDELIEKRGIYFYLNSKSLSLS